MRSQSAADLDWLLDEVRRGFLPVWREPRRLWRLLRTESPPAADTVDAHWVHRQGPGFVNVEPDEVPQVRVMKRGEGFAPMKPRQFVAHR